jgi:hypothetical protein
LKNKDALIYLDDILIPPKTISEGMERLQRVLTALTGARFSVNLKKCRFFEAKIQEISENGVRPGDSKVQALLNVPGTKKTGTTVYGISRVFSKVYPRICNTNGVHYKTYKIK